MTDVIIFAIVIASAVSLLIVSPHEAQRKALRALRAHGETEDLPTGDQGEGLTRPARTIVDIELAWTIIAMLIFVLLILATARATHAVEDAPEPTDAAQAASIVSGVAHLAPAMKALAARKISRAPVGKSPSRRTRNGTRSRSSGLTPVNQA
jgi:uncharacterized protein YpmB